MSTSRISILVNGSPTNEFLPQKGLQQGDQLSPFLFNKVTKGLNILLNRALTLIILHVFSIRVNEVFLSHLQLANDLILFCEADMDQVVIVKRLLRCFEVLSGLKINYHKSVICGVGVNDVSLHAFAKLLNCWKRKILFFAGRLTLIKSALSSLPVYYLSLFKMPEGMAHEIEKIEVTFLLGGNGLKRKVHLVKWVEITKSIAQGGLGIRRIRDVNACLLLKWWWKFVNQILALWGKVIAASIKLRDKFLSLFNLSTNKNGSLQQFYARKTSTTIWNFPYKRVLYAWEVAAKARLIITLSTASPLSLNNVDSLVWSSAALGSSVFSVSSLYSLCNSLIGPHLIISKLGRESHTYKFVSKEQGASSGYGPALRTGSAGSTGLPIEHCRRKWMN
ncbi:uncharacterized protein LOC114285459 [Camellia sinensis]|uniref:uncharacterized protein LOC114285459 n=1 Tax=Camellia sinensis TaxID=4442 RepID=UPI001035B712|nr:uncharacterized protein LOC114285459 [Camellia sinensis]